MLRRPEAAGKVYIDYPQAAVLLDFACATYGVLLRCLIQCFGRPGADVLPQQKCLISAAIDLMHVLGDAATAVARLPAATEGGAPNAGMTFTMLRGVEPLLFGDIERCLLSERAADLLRASDRAGVKATEALSRVSAALLDL